MPLEQLLLWAGVIAGPLFIIVFLIEGWLREGYDPLRQPVSSLSIGPRGWVQQANFFVSSILLVASAAGLLLAQPYSFWMPFLIFIYGAGLFGAGVFVTDVSKEGAPPIRTKSGLIHDSFSFFVFASLAAACFVFANFFSMLGEPGWRTYSILTGILYICGFFLFARAFSRESSLNFIGGLLQRITISLGAIWLTLALLHLLTLI